MTIFSQAIRFIQCFFGSSKAIIDKLFPAVIIQYVIHILIPSFITLTENGVVRDSHTVLGKIRGEMSMSISIDNSNRRPDISLLRIKYCFSS